MKNFIPKPYKKEQISIRVDVDTLEKIDKICFKYDLSRSMFISRCIDFSLENMPEERLNKIQPKLPTDSSSENK